MNQSQGTTAPSPSTRTPGVGQQFGVPGPSPAPLHTTAVATRTPNHGEDGGVPHWGCTPRAPLSLIAEFPISSLPPAGGGRRGQCQSIQWPQGELSFGTSYLGLGCWHQDTGCRLPAASQCLGLPHCTLKLCFSAANLLT